MTTEGPVPSPPAAARRYRPPVVRLAVWPRKRIHQSHGEHHRSGEQNHQSGGASIPRLPGHHQQLDKIEHDAFQETTHGPDHPDVASTLNNLGSVLRDLRQLARARSLHERALRIFEACYGSDHPVTRRSRHWLHILNDIEAE